MQRLINNIIRSRAPLMVALRYVLIGLLVLMGLARLRLILMLLATPTSYTNRDIVQEYLMAKAVISGINPYQPLNGLMQIFIGNYPYFPHQAPYPPFVAIMFIPSIWLSLKGIIITWFIIELVCLAAIACMLTILWNGRLNWNLAIFIFFILLAWYPVMNDLYHGQLSILLTLLVFAGLLALHKERKVQTGIFIGISIAIKLITWPLIIYFLLKKDWRTVVVSSLTALGLNFVTLLIIGIKPFLDYLKVTSQVVNFWRLVWDNTSLWSIGYRLFEGTKTTIVYNTLEAPPLIFMPKIAPLVSTILVVGFLLIGLVFALHSKDVDVDFAILACVIVAISPISWDHYFVMIIISLVVMLRNLARNSFPIWQTLIFSLIALLLFFFNDQIVNVVTLLNGGKDLLQAHGNQVTFGSSLLSCLPLLELIVLTFLLWRSGVPKKKEKTISNQQIIPD